LSFDFHIDPRIGQWLNLLLFIVGLAMGATWWQDLMTTKEVAVTLGVLNMSAALLNFVLHGAPAPAGYFPDPPKK
jgi:hypothetical protein